MPSLCNDKLGIRFVKANWMRLLVYIVSIAILSKCTNSRVRPRNSLTRISLVRRRASSSFSPGTTRSRVVSYRFFCRERNDWWTLIEFSRHRARGARCSLNRIYHTPAINMTEGKYLRYSLFARLGTRFSQQSSPYRRFEIELPRVSLFSFTIFFFIIFRKTNLSDVDGKYHGTEVCIVNTYSKMFTLVR